MPPKSSSHCAEFPIVCLIWYVLIQSHVVSKRQNTRWYSIRWSIALSIGYGWESWIDMVISTPSCSYRIWNTYFQNHRRVLPCFLLIVWFDTVEFNCLPCINDKIYDDAVFFWSVPISSGYIWILYIDRAISIPWYSYCTWNRYIKNHLW